MTDYYNLIDNLLGLSDEEYDKLPSPTKLFEYGEYPNYIELVCEEDCYYPTWKIFKCKDVHFLLRVDYHPEYGYDYDYECHIVKPVIETMSITKWVEDGKLLIWTFN